MLDAIPFDMPPQVPFVIVEGRVAGDLPVRLLLDTGAAAPFPLIVSPAVAERAGIAVDEAPQVPATGAVGEAAVMFRSGRLAYFALGPVALRDVTVGVSPAVDAVAGQLGVAVDGVVGHRFLAGRRISIDYVRRRLDLTAAADAPETAIPFTLAPLRPLTLVEATINGRGPFLMVLDSGASTTLLPPETASAAGVATAQDARLGGAGGIAVGGARLGRARISLGPLTRDGQPVAVADVLGPARAAAGAPIEGVLGADFFRSGRVTLDYGSNRLWFEEVREEP